MKINDLFIIDTDKLIKALISKGDSKTFSCTREQAEESVKDLKHKIFQITGFKHNGEYVLYKKYNGEISGIGKRYCKKHNP